MQPNQIDEWNSKKVTGSIATASNTIIFNQYNLDKGYCIGDRMTPPPSPFEVEVSRVNNILILKRIY